MWLADGNQFAWLKLHSAKEKTAPAVKDSAHVDADRVLAEEKPELLPWRSRLKGYRLGARLARSKEADADSELHEAAEKSSTELARRESPRRHAASEKRTDEDTEKIPSVSNGELQLPTGFNDSPEDTRPDVEID